jgi:hypothetical protein
VCERDREIERVLVYDALFYRQLFRGVLKWGKAQLPARDRSSVERLADVVSSLLDHIRFPHMSQEEQVEAVKSGCV